MKVKNYYNVGSLRLLEAILLSFIVLLGYYLTFYIRYSGNIQAFNLMPFLESSPYIFISTIFIFYLYDMVNMAHKPYSEVVISSLISTILIGLVTVFITFFS